MSKQKNETKVFEPQHAEHFELINSVLELTDDEYTRIKQNRFVVSDRLNFNQFKRALAWIYWKDLPVLVTTDAILHSIHQTYDAMLKQVEMTILTEKLISVLSETRSYLRENRAENTSRLGELQHDLDLYLGLPLEILTNTSTGLFAANPTHIDDLDETMRRWLEQIAAANRAFLVFVMDKDRNRSEHKIEVGVETVRIFGLERKLDFTQFRARGHYDRPPDLVAYFCAMMWLQLIDFRIVEYDSTGHATLHRQQLAGAYLLAEYLEKSGQQLNWQEIDDLLSAFNGWSDNITLNGLQQFFSDADITNIDQCFTKDEVELLRLVAENNYGQQQIRGQYQERHPKSEHELRHNISFVLTGQRYTIESDIIQQLVYDKLIVGGQRVRRPFPSPFDVLYALGNDHALNHLGEELNQYGYADNLKQIRTWVGTHSSEFWENSFYNHWLKAICTMNVSTTDNHYPLAMRSTAWADKTLQTQLGSWTELRHDNILYVKPPYSSSFICEYPAGYVEPYPALYAELREYAEFGYQIFDRIGLPDFEESYEEAKSRLGDDWRWTDETLYRPQKAAYIQQKALVYFKLLTETMTKLEELAEKELSRTAFSDDDNLFLRSIIVRKYVGEIEYGGWTEEHWDGWYNDLLPFGDEPTQVVADIHTNYNQEIGEVGILHIGLDNPVLMLFSVENGEQDSLYVGPVYTVREYTHPADRMTDEAWQGYLRRHSAAYRASLEASIEMFSTRLRSYEHADSLDTVQIAQMRANLKRTQKQLSDFTPLPIPVWAKSFRVPHRKPQLLDLPPGKLPHQSNRLITGRSENRSKTGDGDA